MQVNLVETPTDSGRLETLSRIAQRLRRHSLVCTNRAGSGHPTSSMSCAELMAALFFHHFRYDFENPHNPHNDRFILSKGHASPVLWAALAEAGLFSVDALNRSYRQFGSDLEGHPTPRNAWVDVATGSLGQGLSIGVGMALKSRLDGIDNRIYVLMGDGETAEGAVWEAAALASHYKLNNLVGIVDVNRLGQTDETMYGHDLENYAKRFGAFGWQPLIIDGHNMEEVLAAYQTTTEYKEGLFMILAKTIKGKGVSFLENQNGRHGKPATGQEFERALAEVGEVETTGPVTISKPKVAVLYPGDGSTDDFQMEPPSYEEGDEVATRQAYATALTKLGKVNGNVIAMDAELKNSTYTEEFQKEFPERFIECYIAEQNMVGMAHGLAVLGKIPFCSSFASFFTRAYDQIRMASISGANIKYAGSHAGISIGEDGPSQMGLEDIAMFRAIHGSTVLYPSDAVSAEHMVKQAAQAQGPVYLRLTRPKTPILYDTDTEFPIGGSKVLSSSDDDKVTLIAAGITVHESLRAAETLAREGIQVRVIDAYSIKPIDRITVQRASDATGVIVTVEDHYPEGGLGNAVLEALAGKKFRYQELAVNGMPSSGDPKRLMEVYGISASMIAATVRDLLKTV